MHDREFACQGSITAKTSPMSWKKGIQLTIVECSLKHRLMASWRVAVAMLREVTRTPAGCLVEPEVYWR